MVRTGEDWGRPRFLHTTRTERDWRGPALHRHRRPYPAAAGHRTKAQPCTVPATVRISRTGERKRTERCTRRKVWECNFSGRYFGFPREHWGSFHNSLTNAYDTTLAQLRCHLPPHWGGRWPHRHAKHDTVRAAFIHQ